jgi:hypothetical protein
LAVALPLASVIAAALENHLRRDLAERPVEPVAEVALDRAAIPGRAPRPKRARREVGRQGVAERAAGKPILGVDVPVEKGGELILRLLPGELELARLAQHRRERDPPRLAADRSLEDKCLRARDAGAEDAEALRIVGPVEALPAGRIRRPQLPDRLFGQLHRRLQITEIGVDRFMYVVLDSRRVRRSVY